MKFRSEINVMPHKALLDPQGKAVANSMSNIGLPEVSDVRIGKHIILFVDADSAEEAGRKTEEACKKLLANAVMEYYEYAVHPENG